MINIIFLVLIKDPFGSFYFTFKIFFLFLLLYFELFPISWLFFSVFLFNLLFVYLYFLFFYFFYFLIPILGHKRKASRLGKGGTYSFKNWKKNILTVTNKCFVSVRFLLYNNYKLINYLLAENKVWLSCNERPVESVLQNLAHFFFRNSKFIIENFEL